VPALVALLAEQLRAGLSEGAPLVIASRRRQYGLPVVDQVSIMPTWL
jgi:hypothetical protein